MNKLIFTEDRVFMSHVLGWTMCFRESHLTFQMLKAGTLDIQMQRDIENIELIGSSDFDFIDNLPDDGTKYLLILEDSCDKISCSKKFEKLATVGRH